MLFKIDKYPAPIPECNDFPLEEATDKFLSLLNYPFGIATKYAFELNCNDKFKEYSKLIERPARQDVFDSILNNVSKSIVELSKPEYIYTFQDKICYVIFNNLSINPVCKCTTIQTKYYKYFQGRYPNCKLYNDGNNISHIFAKVDDKLVGGFMPFSTRIDIYV